MTKEWSRPASARDAILQRIRAALDDVAPETSRPTLPPLPRAYRKTDNALRGDALIAQFIERVAEYKASVRETTAAELPEAIAAALTRRGVQRLAAPADLPADWSPSGVTLLRDEPLLANEALDSSDGVLTACALGIAQTGTIVLDGGLWQGRRALSLIPDRRHRARGDRRAGAARSPAAHLHLWPLGHFGHRAESRRGSARSAHAGGPRRAGSRGFQ